MLGLTGLKAMARASGRASAQSRMMLRTSFRTSIIKRFQSTAQNVRSVPPTPPGKKPTGIKALMKEYGFSALGIYLALSALDLPLFYILVHSMGKEEIEYYENKAKQAFGYGVSDEELKRKQEIDAIHSETEEGAEQKDSDRSFLQVIMSQFSWAEFAIAYTLHKSFIFIRLPITASITPPIVKLLRGWGFQIGSQSLKTSAHIAKGTIKDIKSNRFGTRPDRKKKWFSWFF